MVEGVGEEDVPLGVDRDVERLVEPGRDRRAAVPAEALAGPSPPRSRSPGSPAARIARLTVKKNDTSTSWLLILLIRARKPVPDRTGTPVPVLAGLCHARTLPIINPARDLLQRLAVPSDPGRRACRG